MIGMSADARRRKPTRRKEVERSVAEKKESHRDEVPGGTDRGERSGGGTAPLQNFKKSNTIGLYILKNRRNLDNVESVSRFDTSEPVE